MVGIVDDLAPPGAAMRVPAAPAVYLAASEHPPETADLAVRTPDDPGAVAGDVAAILRGSRLEIQAGPPGTMATALRRYATPVSTAARLSLFLALLAAALGAAGVGASTAYALIPRRAELALRRAVGARQRDVRQLVWLQAGAIAVTGLVPGLIAVAGIRAAIDELYGGIEPFDPAPVAAVVAWLVLAALAGGWLATRSAVRSAPAAAIGGMEVG